MSPAEVTLALEQFRKEVEALSEDALLDKWIAFNGSAESEEPDLGLLKSICLESVLMKKFGLKKHDAIERRKKALAEPPELKG